jgi:DnaJ-class molecular chaperone
VNGRRCSGTIKSAVNALWDECESCRGTGMAGTQACTECAGFGWRLYA